MKEWVLGLAALSMSALLWNAAGVHRQAPLIGASRMDSTVASLEARVAAHPNDPAPLIELCRAYLDRGVSGVALAAIHHATPAVREDPVVQHLWAEALLRAGHAQQAWEREQQVADTCERQACPVWLTGSLELRKPFLDRLRFDGIDDYKRAPEQTVQAFESVPMKWLRVSSVR